MLERFGSAFAALFTPFRSAATPTVQNMTLANAAQIEDARRNQMAQAWRTYHGDLERPLKVRLGQPDDNVTMNFGRLIVDKSVSFLFGREVEFALEKEDAAADAWLKACWTANRKQQILHNLGVNGGVTGHAFVKIAVTEDAEFPRLIVLDPSCVSVVCDPEDYENILEYRIQWNAISPETGKPTAFRQVILRQEASWLILDQVSADGSTWSNVREPVTWGYLWSPIFQCQNLPRPNEFWGTADLSPDLLKVLFVRNFIASNISRILRYHAHPRTYATGMAVTDIKLTVDEIAYLPNPNARLQNIEMQSDLESSLEYLRYLDDQLLSLGCTPPIALGKVDASGPISGVALRLHYQPLLERNGTKQMLYGPMFSDLNAALLELGGYGAGQVCRSVWADPLPTMVQDALLWDELAVASKDTIASKLGFDYAAEEPKIRKEREESAARAQAMFDRGNLPPGDTDERPTEGSGGVSTRSAGA